MRALAITIAVINALVVAPAETRAADTPYPVEPVTIIVQFSAGGSADILTRGIARGLIDLWGRQIVVEIRPGAASAIGYHRS